MTKHQHTKLRILNYHDGTLRHVFVCEPFSTVNPARAPYLYWASNNISVLFEMTLLKLCSLTFYRARTSVTELGYFCATLYQIWSCIVIEQAPSGSCSYSSEMAQSWRFILAHCWLLTGVI